MLLLLPVGHEPGQGPSGDGRALPGAGSGTDEVISAPVLIHVTCNLVQKGSKGMGDLQFVR